MASTAPETAPPRRATAYELVLSATSCWLGGLWSDALGETGMERYRGIERRCKGLLREVDITARERARAIADHVPPPEPEEAYFPMRAVEPRIVEAIVRAVRDTAARDPDEAPHAGELEAVLRAVAQASREEVQARRAADEVKDEADDVGDAETRAEYKRWAASKLMADDGLVALLRADAGPFTEEARSIGLLFALDRMEIVRGLPKHLKFYAVATGFRELFGVAPPSVPDDASVPVPSGQWLAYLTDVAAAAGHPVPGGARDPQNREALAWTGVLESFADRLRAQASRPRWPRELATAERGIVQRLDDEYGREREAYAAHAVADR